MKANSDGSVAEFSRYWIELDLGNVPISLEFTNTGTLGNLYRGFHTASDNVTSIVMYGSDGQTLGQFQVEVDGGSAGSGTFDPAGLGSVDLTAAGTIDRLIVGVAFVDLPATLRIEVHSNGGTQMSAFDLAMPGAIFGPTVTELEIPFASFIGGADFADVSGVLLLLQSPPQGLDLELDYIVAAGGFPTPTATATATASATATATASATQVPVGGPCSLAGQCVSGAACIDDVCVDVAAPAPATSAVVLAWSLVALAAIAALAIARRRNALR